MTKNEKGTPAGAPIPKQDYGTTPGSKAQWLAEFLLDNIGDREHPMKRPKDGSVDRYMRGLIMEKNAAGEAVIINLGDGYFHAGPDDGPAVKEYALKELHRAHEIEKKARKMLDTWEVLYGNL